VQNTNIATASDSRNGIIESALGLDIGPGLSKEQTLDAVDKALTRIEAILTEMEARTEPEAREERESSRAAFRRFMDELRGPISRQRGRVRVSETLGFMKITSLVNGHRLYISKGKVRVGRVDSTLPLGLVPGAVRPTYHNGKIASWLPANAEAVGKAIEVLGSRGISTE
jgi:hypothetical protein